MYANLDEIVPKYAILVAEHEFYKKMQFRTVVSSIFLLANFY